MCIRKKFIWIILILLIFAGLVQSGIALASSVNVTVTARPNWTSVFKVTYITDTNINIEWTIPSTNNVTIRAKYDQYPDAPTIGLKPTDGYLVFSGNGSAYGYSINDTSMNLDLYFGKLYYRAWADHFEPSSNTTIYGSYFGQDWVEGVGVTLLADTLINIFAAVAVFGLVIAFSVFAFWKENHVLFLVTGMVSMIAGLYAPDLIDGVYETTNYGIISGLALMIWAFIMFAFCFRLMFWSED